MSEENITAIIIAVISSNFLVEIGRYLIGKLAANNKLDDEFKAIKRKLDEQDLGITRVQILTLINNYPNRTDEIMKVSKHYFQELEGDWYMTDLFKDWLKEQDISTPYWLK